MSLTQSQKEANARWWESNMKLTKDGGFIMWKDKGHKYIVKNGKMIAETMTAWKDIRDNTPKGWAKTNVKLMRKKCNPIDNPECCNCGGMPYFNLSQLGVLNQVQHTPRPYNLNCAVADTNGKMIEFLHTGKHFEFERLDMRNDIDGYRTFYEEWGACLDYHASMTYPSFKWDNYYAWKVSEGHTNEIDSRGFADYIGRTQ